MSLLSSNKHCRNLYKLCITFQRRFQQTKAKPRAKSSCRDIVPVFRKATEFTDKVALRDAIGSYTYGNIFMAAKELSEIITRQVDGKTGERVMYLCPNDASYLITQWAIWMSGQIGLFSNFAVLSLHQFIVENKLLYVGISYQVLLHLSCKVFLQNNNYDVVS